MTKLPPRPRRPLTRLTSAIDGSERELLVVLRRRLAAQLDAARVPASSVPSLIRQLRAVDQRIRGIDAATAAAEVDDGAEAGGFVLGR